MRWSAGEAEVEQLVARRELERMSGAGADGLTWIDEARDTLAAAGSVAADHPRTAYGLAYDAVRYACIGLLAQQGLRPTTDGGHAVVERAVRAQFGPGFAQFGTLRRRRHELQYPVAPGEHVEESEVRQALATAAALVDAAEKLLPSLGMF